MALIKSIFHSRGILIVLLSFLALGMAKAPPLVGGPAPQFELQTIEGRTVKLSDFKGRFVVLNFWATWCVPCIKEMPELEKTYQALGESNIQIMGVNLAEPKKMVKKFTRDHQLSFPVLLDGYGNTSEKYKVRSLPVTYFITPDGIVREKILGGGLTREIIETKIKRITNFRFKQNGV